MWEKLKWKKLDGKAKTLYQQNRLSEAISVAKDALKIAEDKFGSNHSNVAASLNNLAGFYQDQGKYAEAEPLFKRSLTIREKALEPGHLDIAASLNNLALLFQ